MHQLYRHTHTISTPFSPRPASSSHKLSANPAPTNQSTNDHNHTPQIHTQTHTQIPQPYSPTKTHNHTQTPTRRQAPTTTLTTHREAMPYPDVDAQPASSGLTVRPSGRTRRRSTDAVAEPAIGQARHQAGCALSHTPDQATRRNSTGHVQDQARLGQAIDTASDEASRPVSANFSAKPDRGLIRGACRADESTTRREATTHADVDAPMQVPACCQGCGPAKPDRGQESMSQSPAMHDAPRTVPTASRVISPLQAIRPPGLSSLKA